MNHFARFFHTMSTKDKEAGSAVQPASNPVQAGLVAA
jgi:hypothetical protein